MNSANRNRLGAGGESGWTVTRRGFLKTTGGIMAVLSPGVGMARTGSAGGRAMLRFGMVTDSHYADRDPMGSRRYRQSLAKMTECVTVMNANEVDFLIELGDFKDQGDPATEETTLKYLAAIEEVYGQFKGPRYHVLGNHDMDSISKQQFLSVAINTGIQRDARYYSYDVKGVHCVVLDANTRADGTEYDRGNFDWTDANIPAAEMDWLAKDLASTSGPVLAFVHQQLDVEGSTAVRNAAEVRRLLEQSGKVLAVFQGHHHAGHHSRIAGIHYYTLKAMVEGAGEVNNAYAIVEVHADHRIVVKGHRQATGMALEAA